MTQQILVINGGNAFETHEEYIQNLKNREVTLEKMVAKSWKDNLADALGGNYQVLIPKMPNARNARYAEWKIMFEKIIPLLDDNVIIIGHSLGGIFTAKYLSENVSSRKIKAVYLVAAPYNTPTKHPLVDFNIIKSLDGLAKQVKTIFIYQSKDDKVVPFSNCKDYVKELLQATLRVFDDRKHFDQPTFPEIVEDIRAL
ncbi:MAG: alpha/beta hydrolase [Patescibacteria group bacterium]|jgi:hypothetical protein